MLLSSLKSVLFALLILGISSCEELPKEEIVLDSEEISQEESEEIPAEETPASEERPPEEELPPGEEETPPEDEMPPSEEETPPADEMPPAEEETPPEDEMPPGEEETPPEDEMPPGEEETPPADEMPPGEEETPPEDEMPPAEEETPPEEEMPQADPNPTDGFSANFKLPIRVLSHQAGIVRVSKTFTLSSNLAGQVAAIYIRTHSLKGNQEGFIKVNSGQELRISNSSVDVNKQDLKWGGYDVHALHSVRFTLPNSKAPVQSGENTITFGIELKNELSSGYRVFEFNLLDTNGNFLLSKADINFDNPDLWQAPSSAPATIAQGRELWLNHPLKKSPLNNNAMKARCFDCHGNTPRDLKYFNYSNESIVNRSMFHGLSEEQGLAIASYVRSIDLGLPAGYKLSELADPWDPPFQPGPNLDKKPGRAWSAGAGIDGVLDRDLDAMEYIFPNGADDPSAYEKMKVNGGDLNYREIPMAFQLPDWNEWLPHTHPLDFEVTGNKTRADWVNSTYYQAYLNIKNTLSDPAELDRQVEMTKDVYENNPQDYLRRRGVHGLFRDMSYKKAFKGASDSTFYLPETLISRADTNLDFMNLKKLINVHIWNLHQEFDLSGKGEYVYGKKYEKVWFFDHRSAFSVAAHLSHYMRGDSEGTYPFYNGKNKTALWNIHSSQWYSLQQLINPSKGVPNGNQPLDWNYNPGFLLNSSNNDPQFSRYVVERFMTQQELGGKLARNEGNYTNLRNNHGASFAQLHGRTCDRATLREISPEDLRKISELYLRVFLEKISEWSPDEIGREGEGTFAAEPSSHTLRYGEKDIISFKKGVEDCVDNKHVAEATYVALYRYKQYGVDNQLLQEYKNWAKSMWPNIAFENALLGLPRPR